MRPRHVATLTVLGALLGALLVFRPVDGRAVRPAPRAAQAITPTPAGDARVGVSVERLASTLAGQTVPARSGVTLDRYTYQLGASVALNFTGPVLLYVERGTLQIERAGILLTLTSGPFPSPNPGAPGGPAGNVARQHRPLAPGAAATLNPGDSLSATDGNVGATRNAGDGPLVLTVLLVSPDPIPAPTATATAVAADAGCLAPSPPAVSASAGQPIVSVNASGGGSVRVRATSAGTTVELDDLTLSPKQVVMTQTIPDGDANSQYISLEIEIENRGADPLVLDPAVFRLVDADGQDYPPRCGDPPTADVVAPGASATGWVTFAFPVTAIPTDIVIALGGARVSLRLP